MSTYYDFFAEAKYENKWYNIDAYTIEQGGALKHQLLYSCSATGLGKLSRLVGVHTGSKISVSFEDLAEGTQKAILEDTYPEYRDSVPEHPFYIAGNYEDFVSLLNSPYDYEEYVTKNEIALFESGEQEEIIASLTARELIELPIAARQEYTLYRWDEWGEERKAVEDIVARLTYLLNCFNESIPYDSRKPYSERVADKVRVICRIS
jgi:hypothetical protein